MRLHGSECLIISHTLITLKLDYYYKGRRVEKKLVNEIFLACNACKSNKWSQDVLKNRGYWILLKNEKI
jgi:hypothetical protein